jgi:LacI family transcriptional regulator, galactose operon repressor
MRDVAALAAVSLKTVSRVVNGEPTVAPELAERVRAAAAQLSYQPNLTASNLRRGDKKSFTIGLLVQDVANPFSAAIFRAVENVASAAGVSVLASSLDEDPARERTLASELVGRRADGLIIMPAGQDQSYLRLEQQSGTALVFIDRPPRLLAADSVIADNHGGTVDAMRYLLDRGHRRIAFVGDLESIESAQQRYAGYADALSRAGLSPDPHLVRHNVHSQEVAQAVCTELLTAQDPPSALFTAQNLITTGAVRALRARGLERQVALIGFDDFELADLLQPAVTVVAQDPAAMGRLSAEILLSRIGSGADFAPTQRVVPTRLIVRESAEVPPFG